MYWCRPIGIWVGLTRCLDRIVCLERESGPSRWFDSLPNDKNLD